MALSSERISENLARVRAAVGEQVQVLAAIKYLPPSDLPALAAGGATLVGENRAQELETKQDEHGALFSDWHFIGQLQSRKVRLIAPRVSLIHSVCTESALRELQRHAPVGLEVLLEVNVAREAGKSGIEPEQLDAYIERCPVPVAGLMTMPPLGSGESSRRWFAGLHELAAARGLRELSMGTSQDYVVAAEEGATIIRLGRALYEWSSARATR